MKKVLVLFIALVTVCAFFPQKGWTGGRHFGGGQSHGHFSGGHRGSHFGGSHSHGHFGGGMYRNFGSSGPYTNYGSPAFRSPGFGHPQSHFYSPHLRSRRSYRRGVPFFSPGVSSRRYVYRHHFSPAGPPPVGAPGPTPYASAAAPPTAPTFFYCAPHAFHYTDQEAFFGHLNFAHHVPLSRAAAYTQQVENGLIFSGN